MLSTSLLFLGLLAAGNNEVTGFTVSTTASRSRLAQVRLPAVSFSSSSSASSNSNDNGSDNKNNDGVTNTNTNNSNYAQPKITHVENLNDFLDFLAEDNRLCVVDFYASWCKSCAKFGLKYKKFAEDYGDIVDGNGNVLKKGQVRFAQVEYGQNRRLCRTYGIKKLPWVQIYKAGVSGDSKIVEFPCGPKYFESRLTSRVVEYLGMTDEEIRFKENMEAGQALSLDLTPELQTKNATKAS
jgi:thiol-disulfide isomerase/thioredoxin